jgi:ribosomal protein L29
MAKTSAKDLREKTDQELLDQLAVERKRLFDATVRGASGEAIKPHEKREGKRLMARIQTVLRERALRSELKAREAELAPKADACSPKIARLAAKAADPRRSRLPRSRRPHSKDLKPADHAALRLAETRRVSKGLERTDPGETK